MRRLIALSLLMGIVLCSASCSRLRKQYKEEQEGWGRAQWQQAVREDEQRTLSEDQRRAESMFPGMRKSNEAFWDQMARIYYYVTGATPFDAAKGMLDPSSADVRRKGIVWLSARDWGRQDPYLKYYGNMARTDRDHTVRAMAIRALNRARVRDAMPVYIAALDDVHALVRLEAVKALANMPEPAAMEALIKRLESADEDVDVRVACADALRTYKNVRAANVLARSLRDRQFGVAWQARKSLKLMTGQDYRYDQAAWLIYLADTENPFG